MRLIFLASVLCVSFFGEMREVYAYDLALPDPGYKEIRFKSREVYSTFNLVAGALVTVVERSNPDRLPEFTVATDVRLVALLPPSEVVLHVREKDFSNVSFAAQEGRVRVARNKPGPIANTVVVSHVLHARLKSRKASKAPLASIAERTLVINVARYGKGVRACVGFRCLEGPTVQNG